VQSRREVTKRQIVPEATGRRRAVVGPLMMAVGVIHVAIAPVLFPRSVRSLVDGRVIASVEADPQAELRGLGFWYVTSGVAFAVYGLAVAERERQPEPLPASLPAGLTALGLWGVLLMPKSPFWVFPLFAAFAAVRRRTALRSRDG
jgi:hypothetical protein